MSSFFPGPESSDEEKPQLRIRMLQVIFILIFVLYSVQLFAIQILNGEIYVSRAQDIARRTTIISAQRGEIYDRNFDQPLVLNTDSFAVSITPAEVPTGKMSELIDLMAGILKVNREQIDRKIPVQYYYLYQPVEIAVNVPFSTIATIAENVDALPGVSWQSKAVRNYTDFGSLSHIIGYVGDITRDELTMLYNRGYQQGDIIGKAGIERQYDEILRGKKGRETRTVDVRGRRIAGDTNYIREAPEMGKNLVLTVDRSIQTLAENALGRRMGAIVVMRPATGEILAMVSYPWYNPNIFSRTDFDADYQSLINDPNKPLLNRAIQSSYPPASTFKVVMTTGILAENVFPPEQTIDCLGELSYGDRLWHCHIRRPGHGRLNLQRAMAQSCDIYYWVVGRDYLGVERIVNYARKYGYGEITGIDLPGEISGFIPTPQWKDRRFHERWLGGDTMNMSIGQGYTLVTPIQMANMAAMVVNDGIIYKPHLLKEVRDPLTGAVERNPLPEILHESDIDREIFARVRRDMRSVISEGTARFPLDIQSVEIAGKTGTGEIGLQNKWHSWFTAFAPYRTGNPEERVVVSIIVEAVNDWEWWAPYASAIIFQGIFAGQDYEEAVRALNLQYIMPIQGRRE
ncbi:MAG: penicillin-binding protein 2 [Spirochaetaceae bacterium]|jgi:penicillin-binding protein 2|nr:penicillin-binding protein 2 [Spirochaetaceae bacterium]